MLWFEGKNWSENRPVFARFADEYGCRFLLSADEELRDKVHRQVLDTGIYFDRIRLRGVTLDQYILFHAAKDVYNGTRHYLFHSHILFKALLDENSVIKG